MYNGPLPTVGAHTVQTGPISMTNLHDFKSAKRPLQAALYFQMMLRLNDAYSPNNLASIDNESDLTTHHN